MIRFDFLRMHEKNTITAPNSLGKLRKMHKSQDVTIVNPQTQIQNTYVNQNLGSI